MLDNVLDDFEKEKGIESTKPVQVIQNRPNTAAVKKSFFDGDDDLDDMDDNTERVRVSHTGEKSDRQDMLAR